MNGEMKFIQNSYINYMLILLIHASKLTFVVYQMKSGNLHNLAFYFRKKSRKYQRIFKKKGFKRRDVLLFAITGDGDYKDEMMEISIKMFNAKEILKVYELIE